MLYSYTVDAATGRNSGLSVLLNETSTRAGIEPPTPWLKDGPATYWPSVAPFKAKDRCAWTWTRTLKHPSFRLIWLYMRFFVQLLLTFMFYKDFLNLLNYLRSTFRRAIIDLTPEPRGDTANRSPCVTEPPSRRPLATSPSKTYAV